MRAILAALLAAVTLTAPLCAQQFERLTSPRADRLRVDELLGLREGALVFRAPSVTGASPGISWNPAELVLTINSSRPWGLNDGALWAGTGIAGRVDLGGRYRTGPLTITIDPTIWFARNAAFDTVATAFPNRTPFNYPWSNRIDLPQQPGPDALARITPGQSGARLDWRVVTAGVGTENMWWGPAARHPILMGASADGFPHLDLGVRPVATPVGTVEGRIVWGRLTESAWFDTLPDNDHRLLAAMVLGWRPRWMPGLTVGFQRVFYQTWTDSLGTSDIFAIVQPFTKDALSDSTNPEGNDARDQMLSLTWRWLLPSEGFEVYGEWARNDHNRDLIDFVLEPDHSQAWMMGMQKVIPAGNAVSRVQTEFLHGSRSGTFQVRATPTYYTHHIVTQGFTQRGQILGAGPGPGSDAQFLAFDRFVPASRWGLWLERIRWFDDDYYRLFGPTRRREGHHVTLEGGVRYGRAPGSLAWSAEASLVREWNRHFEIGNHHWNVNVQVGARWNW